MVVAVGDACGAGAPRRRCIGAGRTCGSARGDLAPTHATRRGVEAGRSGHLRGRRWDLDRDANERGEGAIRRPLDAALVAAGLAGLVVSAVIARGRVFDWEIVVFQAVNGLPAALHPIVWILNQYGTAVTIPIIAGVAAAFRRWTLAVALAATGLGVYLLARLMKEYVERGRPGALIGVAHERERFGVGSLGFPSGHAAVAWAITIVLMPRLGRPWQLAALLMAIVVPVARMYVAAHLPLDLIGGAALGVAAASATNLLLGVPMRRRSPSAGAAERTPGGGGPSLG